MSGGMRECTMNHMPYLQKKGNKMVFGNYRGILLVNTVYTVLSLAISKRLANRIIGKYQADFLEDRSTTDHIFSIRQVLKNRMNTTWIYIIFL